MTRNIEDIRLYKNLTFKPKRKKKKDPIHPFPNQVLPPGNSFLSPTHFFP